MNKFLVKSLLGGVSFAALSCSAFAADMPLKAPVIAQPSYSWTGAYVGLHAGAGWANDPDSTVTMQRFTGLFPPGVPHPLQSAALNSNPFPFGGVQIGYNWQLQQRWVVGLEADISISNHTEFGTVLTEGPITDTITGTRGLDWFGTLRGRAGYLIDPRVLMYVTGGLAYGHTRNEFNQAIVGPGPVGNFAIATSSSGTRTGWTGGAGVEYALDAKWSVKAEYDYLAFNDAVSSSNTIAFTSGRAGVHGVFNVQAANNSSHTVQIGLNYHFWGL